MKTSNETIKKVSVEILKPGMAISGYVCDWAKDVDRWGTKVLKTDGDIQRIVDNGIKEVYIDTARGIDVENAPTLKQIDKAMETEILDMGDRKVEKPPVPQYTSFQDELSTATKLKKQARKVVDNVLGDVRMGKQVADVGVLNNVMGEMADSMFRNQNAILSLGLIKRKDEYTFMHSVNVGVFLMSFCHTMGMEQKVVIEAGTGGMLHDVGKMRVPYEIINKKGKLTDEEFTLIKNHPDFGEQILDSAKGISQMTIQIANEHHERFDGTGYTKKLKGEEISLYGQMAAIVDVYDAITSDRSYHKGLESHAALKKMLEWSKYHFNPSLFQSFIQCIGIYPIGTLVRLKNNLIGIVLENNSKSLLLPTVRIIIDASRFPNVRVEPRIVDLAEKDHAQYKIARIESTDKWGIDPRKYMYNPAAYLN